jgi:hypothetical protein
MGQSTDGILFYGFPIEEDTANGNVIAGLSPEGDEPERPENLDADVDYDYSDQDTIWAKKFGLKGGYKEVWKHQETYPVTIGRHCSGDYPMYYVAIKESELTANRGYPQEVKSLEVNLAWKHQLIEFCKVYGLEPPAKFGWYLASYWG